LNPDVFISYSREDQQQVLKLVGYLREQGLKVWMDETDIHGATMWTEEIVEAIHGCTLFILAISSHSTDSKNVVKELALASEREKKILPLYLEESQIPKNMEYQLAGIQNIALYTLDKTKAYEFVHQTIRRLGVGQSQPESKLLGQAEPVPAPVHGAGVSHMPPPKAKSGTGKWVTIAASVVVLTIAGLFLSKGEDESINKTPPSAAVAPALMEGTARIALLPIEVNAPSEDDQWVGGGMGTQLRAAINKLNGVTIISGVSVNAFRGTNRDINRIRENLNVNYIIDCEMAVVGKTVTAIVEFINTKNSQSVWSKTYEDDIDSIFNIKSDIAAKIANSIGIDVESTTASAISHAPTANSEAFKLYTQGRTLWLTRSQAGMKQSLKLYEQAIKLDEQFALAYAGIADSYNMLSHYGHLEYDDGYPKARKYVLEAITRNPNLAEAYISLGWIQFAYEWKLKDSEKSYRKAIQLNPKVAQAYQWLGINLNSQLQYDEAYETFKHGLELDPNHPVLLLNFSNTASELNKFDEAITALNKGFSINPNYKVLWHSLYQVFVMKGNSESEISELIKEIETLVDKDESIYAPLTHYYRNKDNAKFRRYLAEWKEDNKTRSRSAFPMFKLYEVGIDIFIEQAEIAYENNQLAFGFTHDLFLIEHRNNPSYKKFVEKISKGK
tara:strand:+ start:211 stop:2223 length:2013 start_codon:yes stop_codon:yes gene_type:complete